MSVATFTFMSVYLAGFHVVIRSGRLAVFSVLFVCCNTTYCCDSIAAFAEIIAFNSAWLDPSGCLSMHVMSFLLLGEVHPGFGF